MNNNKKHFMCLATLVIKKRIWDRYLATLGIKLLMLFLFSVDLDGVSSAPSILANFWYISCWLVVHILNIFSHDPPKIMNNSFFIWLHGTSSTGSRIKILQKTILYAPVTCHVSSQFTESNCNKFFWSSLAVQWVSSVVQIVVNPSQPPSNLGSQWYCWTTSQPIWF